MNAEFAPRASQAGRRVGRRRWAVATGLVVLSASLGVACISATQRAVRQKRAVAAITEAGGLVLYDYMVDDALNPVPNASPRAPAWLRSFIGDDLLDTVVGVDLTSRVTANAAFPYLKDLPRLRRVSLAGPEKGTSLIFRENKNIRGVNE